MAETTFVTSLMQQAPGMGAIIVVVILFLRSIEKRDQLFVAQMQQVSEKLASVETKLTSHDQWEREVIEDIQHNTTQKPRRRSKAAK